MLIANGLEVSGSAYAPSTESSRLTARPAPYAAASVPSRSRIQRRLADSNARPATAMTASSGSTYSENATTRARSSTRPGTPATTFAAYALPSKPNWLARVTAAEHADEDHRKADHDGERHVAGPVARPPDRRR